MHKATRIFLVGPPGAGKSSVGKILARRTGQPFVDTDREICRASGRSIAEIFARCGEPEFRRLETQTLQRLIHGAAAIIATGGGILLNPEHGVSMREHGHVIYLRTNLATLVRRLGNLAENTSRPLLQGEDGLKNLQRLLAERRELYERAAHLCLDTDTLSPAKVAEQIISALQIAVPTPSA